MSRHVGASVIQNGVMNTIPSLPPPGANPPPSLPPAYWVPAPVAQLPPAKPLPFHRMARTYSAYRWFKPLLVGLIALGLYIGMMIIASIGFFIVILSDPALEALLDSAMSSPEDLDMSEPSIFVFAMISIILMLPAILWATRMMNVQKVGSLSSVTGRIRWGWLGWCTGVALGVLGLSFGLSFLVDSIAGYEVAPSGGAPNLWLMVGLTLVLVPFQAAAEEYVFRGYLMQLIGGWLRHPAFAILLPIPFFVLGHDYDIYGQLDVGMFALAAGWLTWRTGGLEAAIALHVVNNVLLFLMGAVGLIDVNDSAGSLGSLIFSTVTTGVFVLLVLWLANRRNIQRFSTPRPPAPVLTAPGYWVQPGGWTPPPAH